MPAGFFARAILAAAMAFASVGAADARARVEIVVDAASGDILAMREPDRRVHPASLTKMMTLYLVFEALKAERLSLDQKLVVSRHAAGMPASRLGLKAGRTITVRDAIYASAVRSANDAAVVLAEAVAGSEGAFARAMTARAAALGLTNTVFKNATGLTMGGHLSTARDMATLARRIVRDHPEWSELFSKRRVAIAGRHLRSTNTLLGRVDGVDGLKTGYTRAAGHNLAASALRGDRRILAVVMGESSRSRRDRRVKQLIDSGFAALSQGAPRRLGRLPDIAPRQMRPSAAPAPAPALIAAAPAPAPARRPASLRVPQAEPRVAARWAVQVGAFSHATSAESALSAAAGLGLRDLVGASAQIAVAGGLHRARFEGLDEAAARRICAALAVRGDACAPVPPGGWTR